MKKTFCTVACFLLAISINAATAEKEGVVIDNQIIDCKYKLTVTDLDGNIMETLDFSDDHMGVQDCSDQFKALLDEMNGCYGPEYKIDYTFQAND